MSWESFYCEFLQGQNIYEFLYKDKFIYLGCENQGIIKRRVNYIFAVHYHNNTGYEVYETYSSPQELLNKAKIDGKSLKDLWGYLVEI